MTMHIPLSRRGQGFVSLKQTLILDMGMNLPSLITMLLPTALFVDLQKSLFIIMVTHISFPKALILRQRK